MIVTFGVFNIIIAIYIENTMEAAKISVEMDKRKRYRESLRIAHTTKALVKKFAIASRACDAFEQDGFVFDVDRESCVSQALMAPHDDTHDLDLDKMVISKDLFLLVIQDPSVQSLMDTLEIPPDRAELFDVLDAESKGGLYIQEVVMGMLKVRGDARRSDLVATLLKVRSLQLMCYKLSALTETIVEKQDALVAKFQSPDPNILPADRYFDGSKCETTVKTWTQLLYNTSLLSLSLSLSLSVFQTET